MSTQPRFIRMTPFPMMHEQHTRSYRIWTSAELTASELKLRYKIEAAHPKEFVKIVMPQAAGEPKRMKELWNDTCFECFIPALNSEAYLEINAAPNGNWNMFAFRSYRSKLHEFQLEIESQPKQSALSQSDKEIDTLWTIPLTGIREGFLSVGQNEWEFNSVGLTAVLNTTVATTYWAVEHAGVKPDFHLKSSFSYPV